MRGIRGIKDIRRKRGIRGTRVMVGTRGIRGTRGKQRKTSNIDMMRISVKEVCEEHINC